MTALSNLKLPALGLVAAIAAVSFAGSVSAQSRGYCDGYARDMADRSTGAGDVLAGTIGGALTGALIGGAIDGGEGAGKGAIIGGVGGTVLGGGSAQAKWRSVYDRAFYDCMSQRRVQPVARPAKARNKSWAAACAQRYRSFDPDTGMYLSNSGRWRPCRL